ncbi:hypothetical protein PVAP13_9KG245426 [Panicum virgatum]|uniref:Uncharacterized protein n=1 Tax=Panicum virgatum TaxID=38727 RepID=A0A8T0NKL5_PANVG|nr:hypothetical protein PVAP13_9KG245426 [Panicum virgatum]
MYPARGATHGTHLLQRGSRGNQWLAKGSPIHKVTDDVRWAAEDLFGRLCIVAHAAFLYAGFHPSSAPVAKPWSLSCTYSVLPPAAAAARHRDETAVGLRLYRPRGQNRRGRAHVALRAYVVTACGGGGRYMERRERLGPAALEAVLSGDVDETARALRAPPGSTGEGLWKLLADQICRGLFLYVCEANGVPVMPDVAMAEAVSKELRNLVADHDSDLWKGKYEAIVSFCPHYFRKHPIRDKNKNMPLIGWKEWYVKARQSMSYQRSEPNPMPHQIIPPIDPRTIRAGKQ